MLPATPHACGRLPVRSEVRGSLEHLPRSLPTEDGLFAMRRAAGHKQGIVVLRPATLRRVGATGERQPGTASTVGGKRRDELHQARRRDACHDARLLSSATKTSLSRSTRPIPTAGRSCTIARSTRLVGCYAPGTSLARCTTPRETLNPVVCLSLDRFKQSCASDRCAARRRSGNIHPSA